MLYSQTQVVLLLGEGELAIFALAQTWRSLALEVNPRCQLTAQVDLLPPSHSTTPRVKATQLLYCALTLKAWFGGWVYFTNRHYPLAVLAALSL